MWTVWRTPSTSTRELSNFQPCLVPVLPCVPRVFSVVSPLCLAPAYIGEQLPKTPRPRVAREIRSSATVCGSVGDSEVGTESNKERNTEQNPIEKSPTFGMRGGVVLRTCTFAASARIAERRGHSWSKGLTSIHNFNIFWVFSSFQRKHMIASIFYLDDMTGELMASRFISCFTGKQSGTALRPGPPEVLWHGQEHINPMSRFP